MDHFKHYWTHLWAVKDTPDASPRYHIMEDIYKIFFGKAFHTVHIYEFCPLFEGHFMPLT